MKDHYQTIRLACDGSYLVVARAASAAAQANEVTDLTRIAATRLLAFSGPGAAAPLHQQMNMAMTQGAVYDAVNAIEPRHRLGLPGGRLDAMASNQAAFGRGEDPGSSRRGHLGRLALTKQEMRARLDHPDPAHLHARAGGRTRKERPWP